MSRHRLTTHAALALALVLAGALNAGAQPKVNRASVANAVIHDTLRWDDRDRISYKITDRITPKTTVTLRLTHFNFLRYEPAFSTEAKTIQGYAELEKLWTQVLGFNPLAAGFTEAKVRPGRSAFIDSLAAWRIALTAAEEQLGKHLADVPDSVGLTNADIERIEDARATEALAPKALETRRLAVHQLLLNPTTWVVADSTSSPAPSPGSAIAANPNAEAWYAQQLYDAELQKHDALVARINVFLKRAAESVNGRIRQFDTQKAGTIVTTSITVTPLVNTAKATEIAAKQQVRSMSYYVQSPMPLVFHAGPAYTNIADVNIEKVDRPAVGDVFQEVTKPKSDADLIAFMTYMLRGIGYDTPGFGLTIGTGLKDIGKRLYFGGTAKFNERLFLTGGAFSQTVKEGDAALVANGSLFASVKNVAKWGYYVSISVAPF
jgi:hypothetical protein